MSMRLIGVYISFLFLMSISFSHTLWAAWPWSKKSEPPKKATQSADIVSEAANENRNADAADASAKNKSFDKILLVNDSIRTQSRPADALKDYRLNEPIAETQRVIPRVPVPDRVPQMPVADIPKIAPVTNMPPDAQIIDIQRQISEIIRINESLKQRYQSQAGEIQRIVEQSKIHQRILNDLEESNRKKQEDLNADSQLKKEKVSLINEQTRKNKETIDLIEQGNASN